MFCGWEGNRRSGVALAMRHRLCGLSSYGIKGQCAGDEHPTTELSMGLVDPWVELGWVGSGSRIFILVGWVGSWV